MAETKQQRGARVTLRGNSGCDVLAGMVSTQERRQPGLADALKSRFSRGILAERALWRKVVFRPFCPRGSSRNSVTTSASQTTVRVTQSMTQNPDSPNGVCLGHGQLVDAAESTLVFAPPSAFRTVSRLTATSRSKTRSFSKTGAVNTSTGEEVIRPFCHSDSGPQAERRKRR